MRLSVFLDSLTADMKAYVVAESTWACEDPALRLSFMEALAKEGQAYVDSILRSLVGGAKAGFLESLAGVAVSDGAGDMSRDLAGKLESIAAGFDAKLERSVAAKERAREGRKLLKAVFDELDGIVTDQMMGVPFPGIKDAQAGVVKVVLPDPARSVVAHDSFFDLVARRKSLRAWADSSISLPELSWLLYATQGLRGGRGGKLNLRTVPSAGSRHAFETYVAANRVDGLANGVWRYRPTEHDLVLVRARDDLAAALGDGTLGQSFVGKAPVSFVWTAIPARMEWRYCGTSPKVILLDAGHVCQNLYLAAESIGCGACAIAAYDQALMDRVVEADGIDEMVVYMAPVGRRG